MGMGKISLELSKCFMRKGVVLYGSTLNEERAKTLKKIGVTIFDRDDFSKIIKTADSLLITAPPDANGCPVLNKYKNSIVGSNLSWIGYVSSTGVYGNYNGELVKEDSILKSQNSNNLFRVKAENQFRNLTSKHKIPLCIFRLSGIYGIDRNILIQIIKNKFIPIHKKNHFFNRIHEKDIARVLSDAAISKSVEGVINLSDDKPATQLDVAKYAYQLLGKKIPKIYNYDEVFKTMSPNARKFWENSRKIDNSILKKKFGKMIYSSYEEGLSDIFTYLKSNSSFKF